jgi:hypothetical protein
VSFVFCCLFVCLFVDGVCCRHKALQQELEHERERSMSFDQDASLARETVNCMLDDVIKSLESEKADIRRALRTTSQL